MTEEIRIGRLAECENNNERVEPDPLQWPPVSSGIETRVDYEVTEMRTVLKLLLQPFPTVSLAVYLLARVE